MLSISNKIEEFISMVFLAAIVIFVFAAAIMRTVGFPIIWSVEVAQLLFVWVCMLGANQALRRDEHVGVDFLVRRLSEKNRVTLDFVLYIVIIVFLLFMIGFGIQLTLLNPERTLGSVALPYSWVTAAIPFGCALMLITTAHKIVQFWRQLTAYKNSGESA